MTQKFHSTFLGTKITADLCIDAEVDHRIRKAWNYFWAQQSIFLNKHALIKYRIKLWHKTIALSALWCTETLDLSPQNLEKFDRMQTQMFASMLRIRRRWDIGETWIEWFRRKNRVARQFAETEYMGTMSSRILQKHWNSAGHVACLPQDRIALRATTWVSQEWKRTGTSSRRGAPVYAPVYVSFSNPHILHFL